MKERSGLYLVFRSTRPGPELSPKPARWSSSRPLGPRVWTVGSRRGWPAGGAREPGTTRAKSSSIWRSRWRSGMTAWPTSPSYGASRAWGYPRPPSGWGSRPGRVRPDRVPHHQHTRRRRAAGAGRDQGGPSNGPHSRLESGRGTRAGPRPQRGRAVSDRPGCDAGDVSLGQGERPPDLPPRLRLPPADRWGHLPLAGDRRPRRQRHR